jgi:hydrid cluster protein-associated redox disulfide domain
MTITKKTIIGDIIDKEPEKINILLDAGMHCIGCVISEDETLEEACMVHGIDVDDLVEELNREEINTSADDSQDLY